MNNTEEKNYNAFVVNLLLEIRMLDSSKFEKVCEQFLVMTKPRESSTASLIIDIIKELRT